MVVVAGHTMPLEAWRKEGEGSACPGCGVIMKDPKALQRFGQWGIVCITCAEIPEPPLSKKERSL